MDLEKLEERIHDVEKEVDYLKESFNTAIFFNACAKEMYNFELLKYLFEKLGIEEPDTGYKFVRGNTPSDSDR